MTANMQEVLEKQRASFIAALPEPMSVRRDRIDRAIALLIDHAEDLPKPCLPISATGAANRR